MSTRFDSLGQKRKNSNASSQPSSRNNSAGGARFGYKGPIVDAPPAVPPKPAINISNTMLAAHAMPVPEPSPAKRRRTRSSKDNATNHTQHTNGNGSNSVAVFMPDPVAVELINEIFTADYMEEVKQAVKKKVTAGKFAYKEIEAQQSEMIKSYKDQLKSLPTKHATLIAGISALERSLIDNIRTTVTKAQQATDQHQHLQSQIQQLSNTVQATNNEKHKLETQLHELQHQSQSINSLLAAKDQEKGVVQQQLQQTTTDLTTVMTQLEVQQQENSEIKTHLQQVNAQLATATSDLQALTAVRDELETKFNTSEGQLEATREMLLEQQQEHMQLADKYESLDSQQRALQTDKQQLQQQLAEAQQKITQHVDTLTAQEKTIVDLQHQHQQLQHQITTLEDKHSAELQHSRTRLSQEVKTEKMKIEFELQSKHDTIANLQREREILTTAVNDAKLKLETSKQENTTLHKDLSKTEALVASLESEKNSLHRQLTVAQTQLDAKNTELASALQTFGRSQDILDQNTGALRKEKDLLEQKYEQMNVTKHQLDVSLRELQDTLTNTKLELKSTQELLEKTAANAEQLRVTKEEEIARLKIQEELLKNQLVSSTSVLQVKLDNLQGEHNTLKTAEAAARQSADTYAAELVNFKKHAGVSNEKQLEDMVKASMEVERLRNQLGDKANLAQQLNESEQKLMDVLKKLREVEKDRRHLHNQVQELKGNVRVMVRVRPFSNNDTAADTQSVQAIETSVDGKKIKILTQNASRGDEVKQFSFDNIFHSQATQVEIFEEVSQLVQSALDGYNVCLFSYGQTGSGKTFTMQGGNQGELRGIIPRSVALILKEVNELRNEGWTYELEASFLEIYNESVRDLLCKASPDGEGGDNLDIKKDTHGNTRVEHLTRITVSSEQDVATLVSMANKRRATAKTDMNERSSRSHSVFTLYLTGSNKSQNTALSSSLNLVDLAGSERLSRTGTQTDSTRMKETQAINKSLSALADVFTALGAHQKHIPYRNSKLTYLLEPCFSGDGKTLMIVNLSPTLASAGESLCSLRFASQVSQCELGKPKPKRTQLNAASNGDDDTEMQENHAPIKEPATPSRPATASGAVKKLTASKSSAVAPGLSRIGSVNRR